MLKNYLIILIFLLVACHSEQSKNSKMIVGKWKTIKTKMDKTDISKRSDPTNENGLEFRADGSFVSFGNPMNQDKGTYSFSEGGKNLEMKGENGVGTASIDWRGDTLLLAFPYNKVQTINMTLCRME